MIRLISFKTLHRTGREVWFTSGSFVTAIRSSAAMPGVFAPVSYKAPGSEHQQWLAGRDSTQTLLF